MGMSTIEEIAHYLEDLIGLVREEQVSLSRLIDIINERFGGELNDSLDNLWFSALFVRRSILLKSDEEFGRLAWAARSRPNWTRCSTPVSRSSC